MSFVDNDKKIVWQNGATGGTPMSAENLNKVNEETSNAFDKMNSSVDTRIKTLKDSLVGSQATEVVKDAENVTKTLNGKPLSRNGGIFENDGVTAKNATNTKNVSTSINNKLISDIFEDDGVTAKNATEAVTSTSSQRIVFFSTPPTEEDVNLLSENEIIVYLGKTLPSPSLRFDKVIYLIF